ncbi:hypothetical protein [Streptomyces sp. NPDC057939]|uniref:hypothetical protein n=1 Tax=Streptomyces sp. NPDC057939 TaxID=3346284 RepID=UPI0036E4A4E3
MDVVAPFPPDAEPTEAAEPGDRPLDTTSVDSVTGFVRGAAAGDHRLAVERPNRAAVFVAVVATK